MSFVIKAQLNGAKTWSPVQVESISLATILKAYDIGPNTHSIQYKDKDGHWVELTMQPESLEYFNKQWGDQGHPCLLKAEKKKRVAAPLTASRRIHHHDQSEINAKTVAALIVFALSFGFSSWVPTLISLAISIKVMWPNAPACAMQYAIAYAKDLGKPTASEAEPKECQVSSKTQEVLYSMGFTDRDLNKKTLQTCNDDVSRAMEMLMKIK